MIIRLIFDRLSQSTGILLLMSFIIFALMGLMPGDPIDLMISSDPKITSEDAKRLRNLYGLDKPLFERYKNWLWAALSGDLGYSRLQSKPALEVLWPALVNTSVLLGLSFGLSIFISLPSGIIAAVKQYSKTDYFINFIAFAGISTPPFWLALLLIIIFAVILGVLPASGMGILDENGLWDTLYFMALPVMSLTIASFGGQTRYMRAAMIEVLRHDYIRTARAKGLSKYQVVLNHALRNALIPVVTIIALDFGALFSGALITETIFAYPGMGRLIFDSIMGNDFNVALLGLLFATALTLFGSILADIAYVRLDPRIYEKVTIS